MLLNFLSYLIFKYSVILLLRARNNSITPGATCRHKAPQCYDIFFATYRTVTKCGDMWRKFFYFLIKFGATI